MSLWDKLFGRSKKRYVYPAEIADIAKAAQAEAKAALTKAGIRIIEPERITIKLISATKKVGRYYTYFSQVNRRDVSGEVYARDNTRKPTIAIAHKPGDPRGFEPHVLVHELCHVYLIQLGIWTHDPRLRGLVANWKD